MLLFTLGHPLLFFISFYFITLSTCTLLSFLSTLGLIFEGSRSSNFDMMILVLLLAKKDIGITDQKEMENSELLKNIEIISLNKIENVYLCACVLYLLRENGSSLLPL